MGKNGIGNEGPWITLPHAWHRAVATAIIVLQSKEAGGKWVLCDNVGTAVYSNLLNQLLHNSNRLTVTHYAKIYQ